MKPAREWDEEYLYKSLPVGEFDWFEVKGRKALDITIPTVKEDHVRNTLSKAISAFSNTDGGFLIYGLENPSGKYCVDDGGIVIDIKGDTREWLETIIPNLVEFPLNKFNVYMIPHDPDYEESQISQKRALYLIDIPVSDFAPHQAFDKKYYARVAGRSQPLGHRLVVDIMRRRKDPLMELKFTLEFKEVGGFAENPTLRIDALNKGKVYARYINCFLFIPKWMCQDKSSNVISILDGKEHYAFNETNTVQDILDYKTDSIMGYLPTPIYGPSFYYPILPGLTQTWKISLKEKIPNQLLEEEDKIYWEIYADNAPVQLGNIFIKDIENKES